MKQAKPRRATFRCNSRSGEANDAIAHDHPDAVAVTDNDAPLSGFHSWQHITLPVRQHPLNGLLEGLCQGQVTLLDCCIAHVLSWISGIISALLQSCNEQPRAVLAYAHITCIDAPTCREAESLTKIKHVGRMQSWDSSRQSRTAYEQVLSRIHASSLVAAFRQTFLLFQIC